MKRSILIVIALFIAVLNLSGRDFPDSAPVRRRMSQVIFSPVGGISIDQGGVIEDRFSGQLVKFEVERNSDNLYLIFINQRQGSFPLVGAGNFIIRRDLTDGSFDQVKIFLDDIGALVLRITPSGRRSSMSLSLFNDELYSRIPLGVSLEQVMEMDIPAIMALGSGRIPWEELFPPANNGSYGDLISILSEMRTVLPNLPDAEDGAMDEFGNLVRIETLRTNDLPGFNCSGFAKYLSDGVYAALTGSYLSIEELKIKHPELRGNDISLEYEDERDPYFGLDWTRNIASAVASARGEDVASPEHADLRNNPWYRYTEDLGFRMENIIPVLYLAAIENPGRFYLGSINGEFGSDPVLWQHYHVVVLFPYFDEAGTFRIAVLERNVESSVSSLQRRYEGNFIHLVGIDPVRDFILQEIQIAE